LNDKDARFTLAVSLATLTPNSENSEWKVGLLGLCERITEAQNTVSALHDLTKKIQFAGNESLKARPTARLGRKRYAWKSMLIFDEADVFEFLAGLRPSGKLREEDHPNYRSPYGEFWDFLSSLWNELLNSGTGLDDHPRVWAKTKKRGEIAPDEAAASVWLLKANRKSVETVDILQRLTALE
jgi:hypothetical protein